MIPVKQLLIKKIAAAFMLITLAFSITPTILLHNWVANHIDSAKKTPATNDTQVSKQLFNCHCDDLVAESAFTEPYRISVPPVSQYFSKPGSSRPVHIPGPAPIFYSLRGPPAV